jgi:S1-C subfamily serine protease/Tfp pilus assembly protein PilF
LEDCVSYRALLLLPLLLVGAIPAGPSDPTSSEPLNGAEIYQRTLPAVVWIHSADRGKGTGWLLDRSRRLLVTNYHVVGENETVEVFFPVSENGTVVAERGYYLEHREALRKSGHVVRGKVLHRNPDTDLALIELESVPEKAQALRLSAASAQPGDRVHSIGNRYDCDPLWVYTTGAVRQVRVWRDGYFNSGKQLAKGAHVLLTQSPINEGDSGGPLVNERGEVVGVSAAVIWEANGGGLFIDVREVRALLNEKDLPTVDEPSPGRAIYRRGLQSLALVQSPGGEKRTGWLLDRSRRLLLTTAEAVGKHEKVDVTFPVIQNGTVVAEFSYYRDQQTLLKTKGLRVQGCVLAKDARRNVALLELDSVPDEVREAKLAKAPPTPGEAAHLLGNATRLDLLWLYSAASVRQLGQANLGQTSDGPDPAVIVIQAPVTENDGGGLLFDQRGEVAGMVSGKVGPQQQVAFCLPVAEIEAFVAVQETLWKPRTAIELCNRGAIFVKAHLYERADRDFTAALEVDSKCATAYSERGGVRFLQGNLDGALADCNRALEFDEKLVTAYCHRAAVSAAKGEAAKAVADCNAALRLQPECAAAFAERGNARRLLGDLDKAVADCDEAIWHDRKLAVALLYKAQVHAAKNDPEKAIAASTQALQLDPLLHEAFLVRGAAQWARSDVAASLADYTAALALKETPAAYHGRGRALSARGEYDKALADYNAALRLDSRYPRAYLDRGSEWLRRGDQEKAFVDYAEAVRRQPKAIDDILAVVERRAAEITKDGLDNAAVEVSRRALELASPLFVERPEVKKLIDDSLGAAKNEPDLHKRALLLEETIGRVRGRLVDRH